MRYRQEKSLGRDRSESRREKFDLLKLSSELAERESDRGMARYNLFLVIQSALVGLLSLKVFYTNDVPSGIAVLLLSAFGLVLCLVWMQMFEWNLYWQDRWVKDQKRIIESDTLFSEYLRGRWDRPRPATMFSGRQLFVIPPTLFLFAWIGIGIYGAKLAKLAHSAA